MERRKNMKLFENAEGTKRSIRPVALILSVIILVGGVVGGTLAWLIADTDPVVNTFTYGDINITLEETKVDEDGNPVLDPDGNPEKTKTGNEYKMIPGASYLKDPIVTVLPDNEACWLFVKLEKKGDFDSFLTYEIADGWVQLKDSAGADVEGVYYLKVEEDTDDTAIEYSVLKDNKISVLGTVTKEMLNALDNNGQDPDAVYPSLSVVAYAVQYMGFEPEITEGATEPTEEQVNTAALKAWEAIAEQNAATNP